MLEAHRTALASDGFSVLPAQVPEVLRTRALRAINRSMGELVGSATAAAPASDEAAAAARSLANGAQLPLLLADSAITGLLNSSGLLDTLTELVVGPSSAERVEPAHMGQVALAIFGRVCH